MVNSTSSSQKLNRHSDMDLALFEALASEVPDKNTGPDPDDILRDITDEDAETSGHQQEGHREVVVALDYIDRQRIGQIMELVRHQTGEQISLTRAIKIALSLCPMEQEAIGTALAEIPAHKGHD